MRKSYFSAITRLTAVVLAVVLALPVNSISTFAEDEIIYGDVNNDESINAEDALCALKHAAKLELLDDEALVRADVDGNKVVDAADALWILKYAAKLVTSFPVMDGEDEPVPTETEDTPAPTETEETPVPTETEDTPAPTETEATPVPTETEVTPVPTETEATPVPTETEATPVPTETEDTPTPTESEGFATLNGELMKTVVVFDETNYSKYSMDSSLALGDLVFGDRDVTFVEIAESLIGAEYLVTSCDNKKVTGDVVTVTAAKDIVLSVGFDKRLEVEPEWIADFVKTDLTCVNNKDVIFGIYQKNLKAGESITLSTQGQVSGIVGYIVMAQAADGSTTPVETPVPSETTPVETPVPSETTPVETSAPAGELIPFSGTVYIASDSIADGYDNRPVEGTDVVGWGNIFANYFTSDVTVNNQANLGDSTKSFWYDYNGDGVGDGQRYKAIYQNITKNDYVIICFGHNDGPANRNDVPVGASSEEEGSYQWYLKYKYIEPALAVGAQPILMTPVVRCFYTNGVFTEKDYHLKYAQAVRDLVAEYAEKGIVIPLIDAQKYTYDLYTGLSEAEAKKYHATNDTTHYNQAGCERLCEYITEQFKTYNLGINQYIK